MRKLQILGALAALALLAACGGGTTSTSQEVTPASQTPPPAQGTEQASAAQPPTPSPSAQTSQPAQSSTTGARTSTTSTHAATSGQAAPATPKPTATAWAPPEPPKPIMVELPAGTVLELELIDPLSSKINVAGDTFRAKVIDAVEMGGRTVIPAESVVEGTVTEAVSAKKMSGQASLSLQFTKLHLPEGQTADISAMLTEKGKKVGKRTAGIVGGSAAGGAVLGRIIGKDTKGAVVGALIGAAAGTGVAAAQKGQELKLPAGTGMSIELDQAIQVPVPHERS